MKKIELDESKMLMVKFSICFAESKEDYISWIGETCPAEEVDKFVKLKRNCYGLSLRGDNNLLVRVDLAEMDGIDPISIICHETSHMITRFMGRIGIEDDEFRSYLSGWIQGEVIRFYLSEFEKEGRD